MSHNKTSTSIYIVLYQKHRWQEERAVYNKTKKKVKKQK